MTSRLIIFLSLCLFTINSFAQATEQTESNTSRNTITLVDELETDNFSDAYEFSSSSINISLDLTKVDNEINEILENKQCEECFDAMMESWFEDFVLLQENGKSAQDANQLASTSAVYYLGYVTFRNLLYCSIKFSENKHLLCVII